VKREADFNFKMGMFSQWREEEEKFQQMSQYLLALSFAMFNEIVNKF
jgi:hypothetical protein